MVSLLIWLKHHLNFIWAIIEKTNSVLFNILWGRKIQSFIYPEFSEGVCFKSISSHEEIIQLVDFFSKQPKDAFTYFKPHGFDEKSLMKKLNDPSFMMIGCFKNNELAGYCFLRFFFNKKAFRGKIVGVKFQGQGLAKMMGIVTTQICQMMSFRLFATISRDNVRSLASSKAVNEIRIVKELPDNYLYVEYLLKK